MFIGFVPHLSWASDPPHKWAVLVGIAKYEDVNITSLDYTISDVQAVGEALQKNLGFDRVYVMTGDQPKTSLDYPTNVNVVKRLEAIAARAKPGDTFLFYFSGHGFQDRGGQNFLGTVNAQVDSLGAMKLTTISTDALRDALAPLQASQVVFVLDACRKNPFKDKGGGEDNVRTQAFSKDLIRVAQSPGGGKPATALIFACQEGQKSYEDSSFKHGVFTHFFLEGLNGKAARGGQLTIVDLGSYVEQQMDDWGIKTNNPQKPEFQQINRARLVLAEASTNAPTIIPTTGEKTDSSVAVSAVGTAAPIGSPLPESAANYLRWLKQVDSSWKRLNQEHQNAFIQAMASLSATGLGDVLGTGKSDENSGERVGSSLPIKTMIREQQEFASRFRLRQPPAECAELAHRYLDVIDASSVSISSMNNLLQFQMEFMGEINSGKSGKVKELKSRMEKMDLESANEKKHLQQTVHLARAALALIKKNYTRIPRDINTLSVLEDIR